MTPDALSIAGLVLLLASFLAASSDRTREVAKGTGDWGHAGSRTCHGASRG